MTTFNAWFLSFATLIAGGVISHMHYDLIGIVEAYDVTRISYVIAVGFILASLYVGKRAWQRTPFPRRTVTLAERGILALGFLGTVIGLFLMLVGLSSVEFSDHDAVLAVLPTMFSALGTAMTTTAAALIAVVCLVIQQLAYGKRHG